MSQMIVIRHAQASMFAADYDQLSTLGIQQAERLGDDCLARQLRLDAVVSGPCRRHRHTAEIVRQRYLDQQVTVPDIEIIPEFDEHQIDRIAIALLRGQLTDDKLQPRVDDYIRSRSDTTARYRSFQRLFEATSRRWRLGTISLPDVESWPSFQARVLSALKRLMAEVDRGKQIAVVTSVGPISVLLQEALQCSDEQAFETGWLIRNTSVSRFLFTTTRFTLESLNSTNHLPLELLTFR